MSCSNKLIHLRNFGVSPKEGVSILTGSHTLKTLFSFEVALSKNKMCRVIVSLVKLY